MYFVSSYVGVLSSLPAESLAFLFLALLTYYVSVGIHALRWKLLLRAMGKDVPLSSLYKAFLSSIFVNNVTPFSRSGGEVLRIAWLKKIHGISGSISAASVIYERLTEVIPFFFLLFFVAAHFSGQTPLLTLVFPILTLLVWILWDKIVMWIAEKFGNRVTREELEVVASLKKNIPLNLAVISLSSIIWALDVFRLKLLTLAVGLDLSLPIVASISIVNFLLGLLAFTPGGIGIVEGGLLGTLLLFGIPHTLALAVTALERLVSYVISTAVGFLTLVTTGGIELWKALKSRLRPTGSSRATEE